MNKVVRFFIVAIIISVSFLLSILIIKQEQDEYLYSFWLLAIAIQHIIILVLSEIKHSSVRRMIKITIFFSDLIVFFCICGFFLLTYALPGDNGIEKLLNNLSFADDLLPLFKMKILLPLIVKNTIICLFFEYILKKVDIFISKIFESKEYK
ncbi:MAG: hypothetical protein J6Y82_01200 [Bacteroidales bacterium]|nr:hypothetical protein [Bacteroidales bacterium]